jgi:AraC family transcriptional regulator, arabinose operon regulatory protein
MELINCGYHYIHKDGITIDRPQGAGNYAFVFFRSRSEVIVEGQSMEVEKNSYILFRPSTRHLYRELEKPFINDWLHCHGSCLPEFLEEIRLPLDTPVQVDDSLFITRCIMELSSTDKMGGPLRQLIMESDLRGLFMKLANIRERTASLPEKSSRYLQQFSRLRNGLYSSPDTHQPVEKLAASVNLSKSYFQHVYKELFGCSVLQDMINGRLELAKYLLDNSSLSVTAISRMCGYENDTHFMRQFKKFIGTTPSQYKAR